MERPRQWRLVHGAVGGGVVSEPITQHEVEQEILRLSRKAEEITQKLVQRAHAAAEADVAFKVCHAKAYLLAEGTVGEREAHATVMCEAEYRDKRATEALQLSCQEAGRNVRTQLDALRTIAANLRHLVTG